VADLPRGNRGDGLVIDDDENTDLERNDDDPAEDGTDSDEDPDDGSNADNDSDDNDIDGDDDDDTNGDDDDNGGTSNEDDAAGLRRSRRATRGRTQRYNDYELLLHARRTARGGPRRATIRDGFMFFSEGDLSDAKPIPVEDRLEYAFGVILQQYSIGAGLKKFRERGEKGVTKELAQMHNNEDRPYSRREEEGHIVPHVPQGKEGQVDQGTVLCGRAEAAGGLDKTRDDVADRLE